MWYTSMPTKTEGKCSTVKLSQKLDALQEMARAYSGESFKQYFIGLLAEHAEEAEMTAEFLEWTEGILKVGP